MKMDENLLDGIDTFGRKSLMSPPKVDKNEEVLNWLKSKLHVRFFRIHTGLDARFDAPEMNTTSAKMMHLFLTTLFYMEPESIVAKLRESSSRAVRDAMEIITPFVEKFMKEYTDEEMEEFLKDYPDEDEN